MLGEISMGQRYDIAVIGAGPGGYVAAIRAAQMGKTVALIEKDNFGGTCLNVGCIPTKALIAHAEMVKTVSHAADFGISVGPISFDYGKMKRRKDTVVALIRKNLESLLKSNQITLIQGRAEFQSQNALKVVGDVRSVIEADQVIIASGSTTLDIPTLPCDHERIVNSTSILDIEHLPKRLAIIGGGYIGCEFASLFAELGVKVTIIEALPSILSLLGEPIASFMTNAFKTRGVEILTSRTVASIDKEKAYLRVHLKGGQPLEVDMVLVSIGRKIVSEGMAVEKAGLPLGPHGSIEVDDRMETAVKGIWAIGDVTGKAMLAHVASHQGVVAATNAAGGSARMHYEAVPAVVFTIPEVATVGLSLDRAKAKGVDAVSGDFPFIALGKAQAAMETEGFSRIIIHRKTGQILGAQVIGHGASTLIAEMALAIHNELTVECLTDTIHAHPTIAEAWLEAGFMAMDMPLHLPPRKGKQ